MHHRYQERIFQKGEEMVKTEMNLLTIMQTIQKLKAGLTILSQD